MEWGGVRRKIEVTEHLFNSLSVFELNKRVK